MRPDVNNPLVPIFQRRGVMKLLRPLGATSLAVLVLSFGACTESVVGPKHVIPGSGSRSVDATETSPNMTSGMVGLGQQVVLGVYPQTTRVIVTATGYSTITVGGVVYRYGLGGHPSGAGGTVTLYGTYNTQAETATDTVDLSGTLVLQQEAPSVFANAGDNAPWTWAGQASGTVQRVDAQLAIQSYAQPRPSTELALPFWGASALLSPVTIPTGMRAAADTASWVFIPDDGTASSAACSTFGATGLCVVVPTTSGTVHVKGYANAGPYVDAQPLHITVPPKPRIRIVAQPTTVSPADTILVNTRFENAPDGNVYGYSYSVAGAATGSCLTGFPAKASCILVPTGSGTLRVKGRGANQIMVDSVAIVVRTSLPPTLSVTCPVSVVRGSAATCSASMSDGSIPAVRTWHFSSTDALLPVFQRDGAAATSWAGDLVISGTITVSASVGGVMQSKSAAVAVTARDWSRDTVEYTINEVPTPFPDPPPDEHSLGSNQLGYDIRLDTYVIVSSGPNEGVAYFKTLPFRLRFDVNYNSNAMVTGSRFFNMQPATARTFNGVSYCARSRVVSDVSLVKKHEGFSADDANSHTDVYKRFFLQEVRAPVEQLVSADASTLNPSPVGAAASRVAAVQSHQITDLSSANPYRTNCVFNYDPMVTIP